jgi:hypothetical protein
LQPGEVLAEIFQALGIEANALTGPTDAFMNWFIPIN